MRTKPFEHQGAAFDAAVDAEGFGLWLDPGLGKSKVTLDLLAHHYHAGTIDAAVIVAPNGVHTAWHEDEIPTHLDGSTWVGAEVFCYYGNKLDQSDEEVKIAMKRVLKARGMAIVIMAYSGVVRDRGKKVLARMLGRRRCALVLDESTKIKSPGAKVRFRLDAAGKRSPLRYALSGTPVTNTPLDLYSQLKFLDPMAFGGCTFDEFKNRHCVYEICRDRRGKTFNKVTGYRDLDAVRAEFARLGIRIRKEDALDLPAKVYKRAYFNLTAEQKEFLLQLKEELQVLYDDGVTITAPLAIQQLTRAQQVVSGFVRNDMGEIVFFRQNPRLAVAREVFEGIHDQAIIWAKQTVEIDQILDTLNKMGRTAVRYDGRVGNSKRRAAIEKFRHGDTQFFVANPAALSFGITLNEASQVVYYSNSYKVEQRIQSEDRCHRIGQTKSVVYTDIIGHRSVDLKILLALRSKRNLGAEITGDDVLSWLDPDGYQ